MPWAVPLYTRPDVDRAGDVLIAPAPAPPALEEALEVINNWRSSHSFPLNTFQITLRNKARQADEAALVAQRIKRLSSIAYKLRRFKEMRLSRMQDIGGCRAVVGTVSDARALRAIYKASDLRHALIREKDYIQEPKADGYRSLHLVYRYHSNRSRQYNGLQIEMQLRSRLQHAWATAVETVGTFLQQALKASQGEQEWLRFFALMGSALAIRERTPLIPDTPARRSDLISELRSLSQQLDVRNRLEAYGRALSIVEDPGAQRAKFFLLELQPAEGRLRIRGYMQDGLARANDDYLDVERRLTGLPGAEAVLVSVESLRSLRRAYPNYFLDTRVFIQAVNAAISR
jgi:hypothetical protein